MSDVGYAPLNVKPHLPHPEQTRGIRLPLALISVASLLLMCNRGSTCLILSHFLLGTLVSAVVSSS